MTQRRPPEGRPPAVFVKEAAMAKYFCSRSPSAWPPSAWRYGGYGFTKDYPAGDVSTTQKSTKARQVRLQTIGQLIHLA